MRLLGSWIYLGVVLLILLAACGPATPAATPTSAGLINSKPLPLPNVAVSVVPPVLVAPPCVPPVPKIGNVASFCANQSKGVGGASYSDTSDYNNVGSEPANSFLVGDSIPANVSCNFDKVSGDATCSGPQNGTFQAMVCASCTAAGAPTIGSGTIGWTCSQGYTDQNGDCVPIDPKKVYDLCPTGSHYDNTLQNCADNVTNKSASVCPPGYQAYAPYESYLPNNLNIPEPVHRCWAKAYPEVLDCQTFPIQLGACLALNPAKLVVNVVPFCQPGGASIGGANITYPAGTTLTVDTKGNHLESCTPGATKPDGTQLLTCFGTAGNAFDVQICQDPANCTSYHASLGTCPVKRTRPPMCDRGTMRCP
jgi:hypothetical protein